MEEIIIKGAIFEKSVAMIEYLTSPISLKIDKILEYALTIVANLKKTHIYHCCKVWEILNRLNKKDYNIKKASELDVLCFAYGISFVKGKSEEKYIEKSVELFTRMENINQDYLRDIYLALKEKIKYLYRNNKTKKERC